MTTPASPFAGLLGQQYVPNTRKPAGQVHRIDPEVSAHRERSSDWRPRTERKRKAQQVNVEPKYNGHTERSLMLVQVMLDGRERTLYQMANAVGAPNEEALRPWAQRAVELGVLERTRKATREEAAGGAGQLPWFYRIAAAGRGAR